MFRVSNNPQLNLMSELLMMLLEHKNITEASFPIVIFIESNKISAIPFDDNNIAFYTYKAKDGEIRRETKEFVSGDAKETLLSQYLEKVKIQKIGMVVLAGP